MTTKPGPRFAAALKAACERGSARIPLSGPAQAIDTDLMRARLAPLLLSVNADPDAPANLAVPGKMEDRDAAVEAVVNDIADIFLIDDDHPVLMVLRRELVAMTTPESVE